jgi:hypothetical protein
LGEEALSDAQGRKSVAATGVQRLERPIHLAHVVLFRCARYRFHHDGHFHSRATATATIPIDNPFAQP